jgi:hypothetical protein
MLAKSDADRAVAVSILEPVTSDPFYMSLTGQPPGKRPSAAERQSFEGNDNDDAE